MGVYFPVWLGLWIRGALEKTRRDSSRPRPLTPTRACKLRPDLGGGDGVTMTFCYKTQMQRYVDGHQFAELQKWIR